MAHSSRQTLSSKVYDQLKKEIITCKLEPGKMFYERDLIDLYGVSKTPVREALKRLIQEDLVQSIPGAGYIITPITLKDVHELFDMRRILEEAAAVRAVKRITEDDIERLELLKGEAFSLTTVEDQLRWQDQNTAFHVEIALIAGNERLAQALKRVLEDVSRLFVLDLKHYSHTDGLIQRHETIISALRAGDIDYVSEVTHLDVTKSQQMVQQMFLPSE